jgi:hypothetical protein
MTRLSGWILALVSALASLTWLGRGALAAPDLDGGVTVWTSWMRSRPPDIVAFSALRLVAVGLGCYLLAAAVLTLVAATTRWHPLLRACRVVSPRFLHVLVSATVVSGVVAPSVANAAPSGASPNPLPPDPPPTMVLIQPTPPPRPAAPFDPAAPPFDPGPSPLHPGASLRNAGIASTWVVRPGDSFWRIAQQLEPGPGLPAYWMRLVTLNRAHVRDVNLIYPGQTFDLPSPAGQ